MWEGGSKFFSKGPSEDTITVLEFFCKRQKDKYFKLYYFRIKPVGFFYFVRKVLPVNIFII